MRFVVICVYLYEVWKTVVQLELLLFLFDLKLALDFLAFSAFFRYFWVHRTSCNHRRGVRHRSEDGLGNRMIFLFAGHFGFVFLFLFDSHIPFGHFIELPHANLLYNYINIKIKSSKKSNR